MHKFVSCLFTIFCCLPAALTETASRQIPSAVAVECKPLPLPCRAVIEKIIKSITVIHDDYDNQEFLSELFVQQLDMLVLMTLVVVDGRPPVCIGNTTFISYPEHGRLIKASGGLPLIPQLAAEMINDWISLHDVADLSVVESTATFCEAAVFEIVQNKISVSNLSSIGYYGTFMRVSEASTKSNSKTYIVTVGTGIIQKQF